MKLKWVTEKSLTQFYCGKITLHKEAGIELQKTRVANKWRHCQAVNYFICFFSTIHCAFVVIMKRNCVGTFSRASLVSGEQRLVYSYLVGSSENSHRLSRGFESPQNDSHSGNSQPSSYSRMPEISSKTRIMKDWNRSRWSSWSVIIKTLICWSVDSKAANYYPSSSLFHSCSQVNWNSQP